MKKILELACLLWLTSASAQTLAQGELAQQSYADNTPSVVYPQGGTFKVPRMLVAEQGRVVFYRNANVASKKVASIYINGRYHASLQRGGYSTLCLSPLTLNVAARMQKNGATVREEYDIVNALILQSAQDVFVRVTEQANGRAVMETVRPDIALPEVVKTREQQHTISRVTEAVPCQEDVSRWTKASPQDPVFYTQNITLGADALFAFGKSNIDKISDKGRRTLDHLIDRIKTEFGSADRVHIHVVGHADQLGSPEINVALSKARSATIKDYFVRGGLRADRITTDGKGAAEPVVSCSPLQNVASIDCNKPNRRVVIGVKVEQKLEEMTEYKGVVEEPKSAPKPEFQVQTHTPIQTQGLDKDAAPIHDASRPAQVLNTVRVIKASKPLKKAAPLH